MLSRLIKITLFLALALFVAGPALSQQARQDQQKMQHQDQQKMQQETQDQQKLTGKVLKQKEVQIKGTDRKNLVLLLETDRGDRVVADLGEKEALKGVELEADQQLELQGRFARVGNRPVFLVTQAKVEDKDIHVTRQQRQQAQRRQDSTAPHQISGKIIREKDVAIKGEDRENKVVLLDTDRGQIVADLGPNEELTALDIDTGKDLEIKGRLARVSDQLILVATEATQGEKTMQIQRAGAKQQQQQQQ